jgi:hypothetical protein
MNAGGAGQRVRGPGVDLRQLRHDQVPDPVARNRHVVVGRVFAPGLPLREEPLPEVVTVDVEQRPDAMTGSRRHAAQPPGAGASSQPQQHGLGLIGPGMGQRHRVGAEPGQCASVEVEASVARRQFHGAAAVASHPRHVGVRQVAGKVQPGRQRLHERGILVGRLTSDVVVKVSDARHLQVTLFLEGEEDQQEGHRVGAAGHCCDDTGVPRPQAVPACIDMHAPKEVWHAGRGLR